mmetsp:Transcript_9496/g.21536  ORF Transcript_9496/g.21536 Transcript_9496/m.21536 type:complete len:211 (+) Transcript_9496:130-762(+)
MGRNAFLRFSSSVAAGALILPQVARAQECVKTYEGCGSCEDPNLRFLTVVSSSENLITSTTIKYTNCGREPFFPGSQSINLGDIKLDIVALRAGGTLGDDCVNTDDVSVVSFPCMTDSSQVRVDFGGFQPTSSGINRVGVFFPRLEKVRFANLKTMGAINVRTTYIALIRNYLISSSFSAIENTVSVTIPRIGCCLRGSSSSGLFLLKIP